MAAVTLELEDLEPFATIEVPKAQAMIVDAIAMAAVYAPCILSDTFAYEAAAKAIIRGAILRWHEAGTGALVSQTVGPFGETYDNRQQRRGMYWPSEIDQLRDLCGGSDGSGAFAIDTLTSMTGVVHADICTLNFGGLYCSCGAVLTQGLPLWGGGWA